MDTGRGAGRRSAPSLLSGKPSRLQLNSTLSVPETEEEKSLTFTERFLVLWGILDRYGRPRPGVIITYLLVIGTILGASFLIVGMTLWR
jgi:hypothetical protein